MKKSFFTRLKRKLAERFLVPKSNFAYSQFGEDLIIAHFFAQKGIATPSYLDIGANEPRYISNSYYFYNRGAKGVLVEPNPFLYRKLVRERKGDIVLNVGIGFESVAAADFYVFPDYANGLSTFSKKEAKHWEETGMKGLGKIPVQDIIKMPLVPVNEILEKYFSTKLPDFISLDVEGLDLDILRSMDFNKFRPTLICVETFKYDEFQNGYKDQSIIDFMKTVRYGVYADTAINTIFCKNDL